MCLCAQTKMKHRNEAAAHVPIHPQLTSNLTLDSLLRLVRPSLNKVPLASRICQVPSSYFQVNLVIFHTITSLTAQVNAVVWFPVLSIPKSKLASKLASQHVWFGLLAQ